LPHNQHLSVPYNCQHFNTKHRIATQSALICSLQFPQHTPFISLNSTNQFVFTAN